MKLKLFTLSLLALVFTGCKGSGDGGSSPSAGNPDIEVPCQIDCGDTGDTPIGVKISYQDPNGVNGEFFTWRDTWQKEWNKNEITKDASYVALADGSFELGRHLGDDFDVGASVKAPYCNTLDERIYLVVGDSLEASEVVRAIKISVNTVSIYNVNINVSTPPLQGSTEFELIDTREYSCENGILIDRSDTANDEVGIFGASDTAIIGRTPTEIQGNVDAYTVIGFKDNLLTNTYSDLGVVSQFTQVIFKSEFEDLSSPEHIMVNESLTYIFRYGPDTSYNARYKHQRTIAGSTTATVFHLYDGVQASRTVMFGLQQDLMVDKDNNTLNKAVFGQMSTRIGLDQPDWFWAVE